MKILFFSTYYYPYISGLTTYPKQLFADLGSKNEITILTFRYHQTLKTTTIIDKTKVIRMPYLFRLSKGFISPQSVIYFKELAKKNDLIILNLPNFEGFILALIAKIFGKKLLAIFHCQVYLKKNLFNYLINFALNLSLYLQMLLSDKIIGYTQDYVTNTTLGKLFCRKFIFSLPPIENLTINPAYLNELIAKKQQKIWLGYSGRVAQEKGLEDFIKAVVKLQLDKKDYQLVFAGPYGNEVVGENQYYIKIKKLLKKYQLPYLFLGYLSEKQLGAFYKTIDLLVLPSINSTEAFGMVQAEAMLQGTPVVSTNLPGVRIPIQLTRMGISVKPHHPSALAKAITTILNEKENYTNTHLIKRAKQIFTKKKVIKFYQQLLSSYSQSLSRYQFNYLKAYLENQPPFLAIIRVQEAELFKKNLHLIKPPILDFGCGDGFFANLVFGKKRIDIGLDLPNSRAQIAEKNQVYKKIVYYANSTIPFPKNYFSTIISNCVLEHLSNLKLSLVELYRVLKPNGYLIVSVMTNRWNDYLFGKKIIGKSYPRLMIKMQQHLNLLSLKNWQAEFTDAGFKIINSQTYLNKNTALWLDIFHYLSLPNLLSYILFKKWVLWPKLNSIWQQPIKNILTHPDFSAGAAGFFILKKEITGAADKSSP
jgi:glycosyltransferase involved in cell wall biosynthesis/SAM-dependent methyltransferase